MECWIVLGPLVEAIQRVVFVCDRRLDRMVIFLARHHVCEPCYKDGRTL